MTEPRERRYTAEYMAETYKPGEYELNVPLGPIPHELVLLHGAQLAAALYRPSRRRIDAVAWPRGEYHLIEMKIRDPFEGLARLPTYLNLARRTDDLPGHTGQRFRMILVVPFALDWIKDAARDAGITLVEYYQEWLADYVRSIQLKHTREERIKRAEKLEARQRLGLE